MIPKIIHQIWSDVKEPLPDIFSVLGQTWKDNHPEWKYEYWDEARMNHFVRRHFPQYWQAYVNFPFDVQRWDAIRFLFLYHHGGMYVDFDSECLSPLDPLLNGHSCCLGLEPAGHAVQFKRSLIIGNALMATVPGHPFFEMIIRDLFTKPSVTLKGNKALHVIETTGPLMTTGIYDAYPRKDDIRLLPAELVAPLTIEEVRRIMEGSDMSDLEEKVEKAYAIHYFFGLWHKHLDT